MKRLVTITLAVLLIGATGGASAASAQEFKLNDFDVTYTNADGAPDTQAGSHPFAVTTSFEVANAVEGEQGHVPSGQTKALTASLPPGMVGDIDSTPHCALADFTHVTIHPPDRPSCPAASAVGWGSLLLSFTTDDPHYFSTPIYNLEPPKGMAGMLGFVTFGGLAVTIELRLNPVPPYNIIATSGDLPQPVRFYGAVMSIWGNPGNSVHDPYRGECIENEIGTVNPEPISVGSCSAGGAKRAFLRMPGSCSGPLETSIELSPWEDPTVTIFATSQSHDNSVPPSPLGLGGCSRLPFEPGVTAAPTTNQAETGTGFDFNVDFDQSGVSSEGGRGQSDIKKALVTFPDGVTINPSVAEGLGVCSPADLARETLSARPGDGCPNASKIGTLHVETPLINQGIDGSVFLAQQDDPSTAEPGAENPFDSLIALYLVLKNTDLGVLVTLPLKVEPNPETGQLVATLENVPQIPVSHFNFHFKEGQRAPLVTPNACGTYSIQAVFTPWASPADPVVTVNAPFDISRGVDGGPCPPGGLPPFNPKFEAGSLNNNAGSYSPFDMRIVREDGEQDMTKFSAVLPPGVLGKLSGVDKCSDSAIAAAKAKTGRQEIATSSCPANSLIGHTLAGAGVGGALTYVKGYIYLGGPYHGDPLSVIAITPAVAGPYDAGTVVVQEALTLNPKTAEVEVDGANSDPIPHILKGIVLKLRDLRVYVDRPNFTLNPTSCDPSSAKSVLFGSYLNVLDPADDKPVDLSTRYQAANCLNLGFKPKLALNLKGGTKRGGHPGLRAIYTPRPGDANIKGLVVRLPRSAFLDQAHIKTICTRVQFAAKECPERSQYGYIKAWTPLLDTPLEGPVYLRSSNHKLPDLVFDLHGLVDIEVSVRIDSAHGGIRATLENSPDAPLSKVVLRMQGAKKGLIINSRNLCGSTNRANVEFTGQNGKQFKANPPMKPDCGGRRKHKRHG